MEKNEAGEKGEEENKRRLGEEDIGDQLPPGQQLIRRYLSMEKQTIGEMEKTDPEIARLKTSDNFTTSDARNKVVIVGSDVVALFPSLSHRDRKGLRTTSTQITPQDRGGGLLLCK